jgi:hypothetical protein
MPYVTVANSPGGYAIGSCPAGSKLFRTSTSSEVTSSWLVGRFFGGYIQPPFDGCGWMYEGEMSSVNTNVHTGCAYGSVTRAASTFIRAGAGNLNCSSPCEDGTAVDNTVDCPAYANFRPWTTAPSPTELVTTIPAHGKFTDPADGRSKPRIRWRYVAKYTSTDGTGDYVMVRDAASNIGFGDWVFVPRSCLGSAV